MIKRLYLEKIQINKNTAYLLTSSATKPTEKRRGKGDTRDGQDEATNGTLYSASGRDMANKKITIKGDRPSEQTNTR